MVRFLPFVIGAGAAVLAVYFAPALKAWSRGPNSKYESGDE